MTQHSPSSTNTITKHKEPSFQAPTRNAIIKTVTGKFPITISDSTSIMEIKRAWAQHQGNSLDDETLNCMLRVVFNHRVWEGDYNKRGKYNKTSQEDSEKLSEDLQRRPRRQSEEQRKQIEHQNEEQRKKERYDKEMAQTITCDEILSFLWSLVWPSASANNPSSRELCLDERDIFNPQLKKVQ